MYKAWAKEAEEMARSKQMAKQQQTQQQLIAGYGRRKPEDVLFGTR